MRREISLVEALRQEGIEISVRGTARGRVLVNVSPTKVKFYSVKRKSNGHLMFRWGRLTRAFDLGNGIIVFEGS